MKSFHCYSCRTNVKKKYTKGTKEQRNSIAWGHTNNTDTSQISFHIMVCLYEEQWNSLKMNLRLAQGVNGGLAYDTGLDS